jgi:hypothetical protein
MLPEHIINKIMLYVTHHPVAMSYKSNHDLYGKCQMGNAFGEDVVLVINVII